MERLPVSTLRLFAEELLAAVHELLAGVDERAAARVERAQRLREETSRLRARREALTLHGAGDRLIEEDLRGDDAVAVARVELRGDPREAPGLLGLDLRHHGIGDLTEPRVTSLRAGSAGADDAAHQLGACDRGGSLLRRLLVLASLDQRERAEPRDDCERREPRSLHHGPAGQRAK